VCVWVWMCGIAGEVRESKMVDGDRVEMCRMQSGCVFIKRRSLVPIPES
jgi:hypothetical protein